MVSRDQKPESSGGDELKSDQPSVRGRCMRLTELRCRNLSAIWRTIQLQAWENTQGFVYTTEVILQYHFIDSISLGKKVAEHSRNDSNTENPS